MDFSLVRSPPEKLEHRLALGFALTMVVVLGMTWMAVRNSLASRVSSDWVNHTHAVLIEVSSLLSSVEASESAMRGFVMSGLGTDMALWQQATSSVAEHLDVAKTLMQSDPGRPEALREIERGIQALLERGKQAVAARQARGFDAGKGIAMAPGAIEELKVIRRSVSEALQKENAILQERDRAAQSDAATTRRVLGAGAAVNFLILAFGYWLVRDDLRIRRMHAALLGNANELLERKVLERTAEITKANAALEVENLERQWAFHSLERHQRHNEIIIHAVGEGVLVVSQSGVVLRANKAVETRTGWAHDELVGKKLGQILDAPGDRTRPGTWAAHPVAAVMKSGKPASGERMRLLKNNGGQTDCVANIQPIFDSGNVVAAIVCFRD